MRSSPHLLWQRVLRRMARLAGESRRPTSPPKPQDTDWAARSAVGEEDPGASVDLLDTRPPSADPLKGDGSLRR